MDLQETAGRFGLLLALRHLLLIHFSLTEEVEVLEEQHEQLINLLTEMLLTRSLVKGLLLDHV